VKRHAIVEVKSTHFEEEKNHVEEYQGPCSLKHHRKCSNRSGESLIWVMGSYSKREEGEKIHKGEDRTRNSPQGLNYRENTLTTPSPPPLTTQRLSRLQTTAHTPSPRINRWLVSSWVQLRFSRFQKRRLASWPAETSSRPSGDSDNEAMAAGWASMVYVH
jgi:hypothetical protein